MGEVAVNQQGRVTIPAQVRRRLGIEPGTPLVIYAEDGRVITETRDRGRAAPRHRRGVGVTRPTPVHVIR